jgi:hypothetical protein
MVFHGGNMLLELIAVKIAIRHHKAKHIVKQKFIEYLEAYDNQEPDADVGDKIRHREIFLAYTKYMGSGGDDL